MKALTLIVTLVVSLLVAPLTTAQQVTKVYWIGFLSPGFPRPDHDPPVDAFRQGLRELGYVEGQNLLIEVRFADAKVDQLPGLAADLVQRKVDLIVTIGTPPVKAAKEATATIPIVMAGSADPVEHGFVATLAQPGGNVTGLRMLVEGLAGKQIELVLDLIPRATKIGLVVNPDNANS